MKQKNTANTILIAFLLVFAQHTLCAQTDIDLAGRWAVTLTNAHGEKAMVALPGTLDTNHLGAKTPESKETTRLTRRYTYVGEAVYERTINIPKEWNGKPIYLHLERTKPARAAIDGRWGELQTSISTPQVHCLGALKSGRHVLTLLIDNGKWLPEQIYANSHAATEDTQTNWNGVIGDIYLSTSADTRIYLPSVVRPEFKDFHIEGQHFMANGHMTFLRGKHDACVWPLTGHVPMDVDSWMNYLGKCASWGINHVRFHSWCPPEAAFRAADSLGIYLQPELPFWGDFNKSDTTLINYLWHEGETIMKTYGRHPSFRMMALGNELWGSIEEMGRFVDHLRSLAPDKVFTFGSNYYLGYQGVKPGMDYFTTCRVGGEAWGDVDTHTRASFSFADAKDGGVLNAFRPNTSMTFEDACQRARTSASSPAVPIISHETGQFQTYPDFDREMPKYTGVLRPDNFREFKRRAVSAGLGHLVPEMHMATGLWAAQQYKADIEMDLRTRSMAGYQLLDLQDYPGQGTALVGILDAFMDEKGGITRDEWRQFVSPVVPLLVTPAYCFAEEGDSVASDGMMRLKLQVVNYGGSSLKGKQLEWMFMIADDADAEASRYSGTLSLPDGEGLIDVGTIGGGGLKVSDLLNDGQRIYGRRVARTIYLNLRIKGTDYSNTYPLWIYPAEKANTKGIIETRVMTPAIVKKLEKGASVLWTPDTAAVMMNTVGGLFTSDYWNYRMFRTISEKNHKPMSPGTLSILTDGTHPIFEGFPTAGHTSWQWWPVMRTASPLILSGELKDFEPIVRVVDNMERSHPLGLVMEFSVGKGKLLVCMADLERAAQWPEGKAFRTSILNYMRSKAFAPQRKITYSALLNAMSYKLNEQLLERLDNISPY